MNVVRLFTLDGARAHDAAVAQWFASLPDDLRSLAKRWFEEFRSSGPNVLELLHDGHPTACVDDLALGYVNAFADHVNVGFYFGAVLPDPLRLLEGSGRYMRHVKLRPRVFVHEFALRQLIHDAYVDMTSRLALRQAKPIRGS